jgi:Omp85 superfamily domain
MVALGAFPAAAEDVPPPPPSLSWWDPARTPVLPIPEIDTDPNSGTTLGVLLVRITTDQQGAIRRILAPDVIYNPNFGWGARARIFSYPSEDRQWYIVGGGKQRVEREFDALYENGRLRLGRWSIKLESVFDRSGTPRYYGVGNQTPKSNETNYTFQQIYVQGVFGYNFSPVWQVALTSRVRNAEVTPGTLSGVPSIETKFDDILGSGVTNEIVNRLSVIRDTRDSADTPTRGSEIVVYGGVASPYGASNESLYSEIGYDARGYWTVSPRAVLAAHTALRYMPTVRNAPFWALSSIGGDTSEVAGAMLLRGFGTSRYYDRNAICANLELRQRAHSFTTGGTVLDLELAPFIEVAQVFGQSDNLSLAQLHTVGGIGFRLVARPTVVAYLDVGYGSEGAAVYTGLNYPL